MASIPTATADTDWSNVGFINAFIRAFNERVRAAENVMGGGIPGPMPPDGPAMIEVAVGDDVQDVRLIQSLQSLETLSGAFYPGDYTLEGELYGDGIWDYRPVTDHALTIDGTGRGTLASDYPKGWRRKKPREIRATLDRRDADDNPAVPGQKAWTLGGATEKLLHTFTGSAWVQTDGTDVDVLDSDGDVPNACPAGSIRPGDYIGPWLFNQIGDLFRKMKRTLVFPRLWAILASHTGAPNLRHPLDPITDFSIVKSESTANYHIGGTALGILSYTTGGKQVAGGGYSGNITKSGQQLAIRLRHHVARSVRWYIAVTPFADTFSGQGDSVIENHWGQAGSDGDWAQEWLTRDFFNPASPPSTWNPDPPPADGTYHYAGYGNGKVLALVDWKFNYT